MEISEPVNELAAARMAEIHEIDHDARRNVAGKKDTQHDQIGFGELVFHLYGALTGFVLLRLAICEVVNLDNLIFCVLENAYVREYKNEDNTEHGDVGEHKSVCNETN